MNYWFLRSPLICSLTHRLKAHQSWSLIARRAVPPLQKTMRGCEWERAVIDYIRNESWLWFNPASGLIVKEGLCFVLNKPGDWRWRRLKNWLVSLSSWRPPFTSPLLCCVFFPPWPELKWVFRRFFTSNKTVLKFFFPWCLYEHHSSANGLVLAAIFWASLPIWTGSWSWWPSAPASPWCSSPPSPESCTFRCCR